MATCLDVLLKLGQMLIMCLNTGFISCFRLQGVVVWVIRTMQFKEKKTFYLLRDICRRFVYLKHIHIWL